MINRISVATLKRIISFLVYENGALVSTSIVLYHFSNA